MDCYSCHIHGLLLTTHVWPKYIQGLQLQRGKFFEWQPAQHASAQGGLRAPALSQAAARALKTQRGQRNEFPALPGCGLVGIRTRGRWDCDKWLWVNEAREREGLGRQQRLLQQTLHRHRHPGREMTAAAAEGSPGSRQTRQEATRGRGGRHNFNVRNQNPQTCIWTSLHTLQK